MARYSGPMCRICRREMTKLFLKGEKCVTKCVLEKRNTPPGQPKKRMKTKFSEYQKRLREKQKAKEYTGTLERQFRRYFAQAERQKGLTGENLLRKLETRLDNVCRLMGASSSLRGARQLVSHGHVLVNGKRVDIPSYTVVVGDTVTLAPVVRENKHVARSMELAAGKTAPSWLELQREEFRARVAKLPDRRDITIPVNEQMIVELYSK